MEITLKLLKQLILEERFGRNKNRKKYLLRRPGDADTIEEVTLSAEEVLEKLAQKEEEGEKKATEEEKSEKEDKRKEAEEEIATDKDLKEDNIKSPPVFEFMLGITVEREVNLDDVYGLVRAIEGVTIVSTEAERRVVSATLERVIIKVKFIKGLTSLRNYKNTLGNAMIHVRGISSVNFIKVRKLPA